MTATETLVRLKYDVPIITDYTFESVKNVDRICETYPEEVVTNWKWRCAADVEDYAAYSTADAPATHAARHACYAAADAAIACALKESNLIPSTTSISAKNKEWNKCLNWLIEELIKYEDKQ